MASPRTKLLSTLAAAIAIIGCANSRATGPAVPAGADREAQGHASRIKYYDVKPDNAGLRDITSGPDYALWFTEQNASQVGRLQHGKFKYYPTISSNAQPNGITVGPDGALWFAEGIGAIGRVSVNGQVSEFKIKHPAYAITTGFDNAVWFTMNEGNGNWIGRMTTSGQVKYFTIRSNNNSLESGITVGRDGFYWFTLMSTNQVGRITSTGAIRLFSNNDGDSQPFPIVSNGGGFFVGERNGVAQVTQGQFIEFPLPPSTGSSVTGMTRGAGGGIWFTVNQGNYIGTVLGSQVVLYKAGSPSSSGVWDIVRGPDDNLWFTDATANRIGRFIPPSPSP
jgi:virginiamycin B lyase